MFAESRTACHFCAAEESRKTSIDYTVEYTMVTVSGILLLLGLFFEFVLGQTLIALAAFAISALSAGRKIIPRGLRGAYHLHLDINFLMTIAAFSAFLISAPAEGAAVLLLFSIAELLEARANESVRREMSTLLELEPDVVTVIRNGIHEAVNPEKVDLDEILAVRPGERIGLDGVVASGLSHVDQSQITGESLPASKTQDDQVYAGSMNLDGYLEIRVLRTSSNTLLARIAYEVEEAQKKKAKTESNVARISHIYTPAVVVTSIVLIALSYAFGATMEAAVYRGLTLLVTSCPCAFAISIPVSMVSAITGLARNGVLVKGARFVEEMSEASIVALDKTGTLTEARLVVEEICPVSEISENELLRVAASLESFSEHPIAQALLSAAKAKGIQLSDVADFQAIPGKGVAGHIGSMSYSAGNLALLQEGIRSVSIEPYECGIGTVVHVTKEGSYIGSILLSDKVRRDSIEAIKRIHKLGIRTIMLTGDNREVAESVSNQLGISEVYADLLPQEKVKHVDELTQQGKTIMVGDGINDAPALAAANVGVAMGAISSDVALETADVALMQDDLLKLPLALERSRRTMRVVKQNIYTSILVKLGIGLLAVLGFSTLWLAIGIGDMGLTLGVVLNALTLTRRE